MTSTQIHRFKLGCVAVWMLILILGCIVFASCATQKNAEKWANKKPVKAAAWATKKWPPVEWIKYRDTSIVDTVLQPGESRLDTIFLEREGRTDTVILKRECPPSQTITRTVTKEKEIRVRDSAWAVLLQGNIEQLEGISADKDKEIAIAKDKLGEAKKSRNWWMWACLITWGVIALYVVLKLRAKIPF
jgi:hypothetical protein